MPNRINALSGWIAAKVQAQTGRTLNARESRILAEIGRITNETRSLIKFIRAYRGPRERLAEVIESRRQFLVRAAEGLIREKEFRGLLPTEQHRQCWDVLSQKGWKIEFIKTRFSKRPGLAQFEIDPFAGKVRFRVSLEIDHPSLIFAFAVGRLAQIEFNEASKPRFLEELKRQTGLTDDKSVDHATFLMAERDLLLQQLDLYNELIRRDPGCRNQDWDNINLEPPGNLEAALLRPFIKRFSISPDIAPKVSGKSLTDIVPGAQGRFAVLLKSLAKPAVADPLFPPLQIFKVKAVQSVPVMITSPEEIAHARQALIQYSIEIRKGRPTWKERGLQALAVAGGVIASLIFVPGVVTSLGFAAVICLLLYSWARQINNHNIRPHKEAARDELRKMVQAYDSETIRQAIESFRSDDPLAYELLKSKLSVLGI